MQRDTIIKGRGLGGSSDLTLLARIKPGMVPAMDSVTYKTRIKRVLDTLHGARTASHEYSVARLLSDSVERVGVIHSVRVAVLEPEDNVMLAVTFDGSWESYIRVLWEKVGTLLDLIFCSTEGYVTAYDHTFEEWLGWARRVQVETGFFYGPPDASARDLLYLRRVERMRLRDCGQPGVDSHRSELRAVLPTAEEAVDRLFQGATAPDDPAIAYPGDERMAREAVRTGLQGLTTLYRLRDLYPSAEADDEVLRCASQQLLLEFVQKRNSGVIKKALDDARERFARQLDWLFPTPDAVGLRRPAPPAAHKGGVVPAAVCQEVQAGILRTYPDVTHGLVLLLSFDAPAAMSDFLARMRDPVEGVTSEAAMTGAAAGTVFRTLGVTPAGLRAAGLTETELELFPEEFRHGMEARAGQLGDVRHNHPQHWRRPASYQGLDAPPNSAFPVAMESVQAVLQLRGTAADADALAAVDYFEPKHPLRAEVLKLVQAVPGMRILSIQSLRRNLRTQQGRQEVVEHFGYADGQGQPEVEPGIHKFDRNRIHLGELVHGHANAEDFEPDPADPKLDPAFAARLAERLRWMGNGSFMVMRKYRQFASRLERAVSAGAAQVAAALGGAPADYVELVYGKLMGRTRDGMPMAAPQIANPDRRNIFDYGNDRQGERCPLHAHIRRAHPRQDAAQGGRLPRLMRRSMSYGPPRDPAEGLQEPERGLLFMAFNADLAQQFEVVQRWLAAGNSTGSTSAEACPILGVGEGGMARRFRFEHEGRVFQVELEPAVPLFEEAQPLTRLEWGLYLFTPSLSVVAALQARAAALAATGSAPVSWDVEAGERRIADLLRLQGDGAVQAWKAVIEDPESIDRQEAAGVWAAIRQKHGGVLRTPYGTLVAERSLIHEVLSNRDGLYSVKGQMERMKESFGEIYLGMDAGTAYDERATKVNEAVGALQRHAVFEAARISADTKIDAILAEARRKSAELGDPRYEVSFEAREVVEHVVADLIEDWFGLEDGKFFVRGGTDWSWQATQPPLYPGHFTAISRYMFQPAPGEAAATLGRDHGQALLSAMKAFVTECQGKVPTRRDNATPAPIAQAIFTSPLGGDIDYVASTMVGVIMGFSPTTIGAVLSVLREWQRDGSFVALRARLQGASSYAAADEVVREAMQQALRMRPVPQLSWRKAAADHDLPLADGSTAAVQADETIVLANVSGTQQSLADGQPDGALMFGGLRRPPHPLHACPAYEAAQGVMLGTLTALLARQETLRPGLVPLSFVVQGPSGAPVPAPAPSVPVPAQAPSAGVAAALFPPGTEVAMAALRLKSQFDLHAFDAALEIARPVRLDEAARARSLLLGAAQKRILGWGDSWLDYRLKFGGIPLGTDLRDCLAARHDMPDRFCHWTTWPKIETMAADPSLFREFLSNDMQLWEPWGILLSGGGNDSTGDALEKMILPRGQAGATKLDPVLLAGHMGNLHAAYRTVLRAIREEFDAQDRHLWVLVHGYDYPIPRGLAVRGWLRIPFENRNYDLTLPADMLAATQGMAEVIDAFNTMLSQLPAEFPFVHHVDLRRTIEQAWPGSPENGWANDLHPVDEGFALMAARIDAALEALPAAPPRL